MAVKSKAARISFLCILFAVFGTILFLNINFYSLRASSQRSLGEVSEFKVTRHDKSDKMASDSPLGTTAIFQVDTVPFRLNLDNEKYYPTIADFLGKKTGALMERPSVTWELMNDRQPRIMYVRNILTPEQALSIVEAARPQVEASVVGDQLPELFRFKVRFKNPQAQAKSAIRTSSGTFLQSPEQVHLPGNQILRQVAAAIVGVPDSNIEATQVLRYEKGQFYREHPDYFSKFLHPSNFQNGGQRIATLFCWLTTVSKGGHSTFPRVPMSFPPIQGNGVLFYSVDKSGIEDEYSFHSGEPPECDNCTKWLAVLWIRQHTFK